MSSATLFNGPYKRTHHDVHQHAAQELKTKKPRQVYKEMVLKDEANAPTDLQQLHVQYNGRYVIFRFFNLLNKWMVFHHA
jgi:hypothetical protein